MKRMDWLSLVAMHSDSCLLSVAFYFGARLNRNERKRLFSMINEMPIVYEVVSEKREKTTLENGSRSKIAKQSIGGQFKNNSKAVVEAFGEDDDEHSVALCGTCGGNFNGDEFWIGCDICERWFHGKCVKITPAKAESIKHKCPNCSPKKGWL